MEPQEQSPPRGKTNPFKDLPKPRQPQLEKDKPQNKSPERQITITLKPWKLVKGVLMLVLLLGVFFAGRLTAGDDSFSFPGFSTFFSGDTGPSGLATGDATEAEGQEASTEAAEEVPAEQNKTEETQLAEGEVTLPAEETDDKPEKFIDEGYSQVTLSLDGVYKEWKGTWGKIKGVKYTITNNEAGTIRPHHFSMIVEGYEDGEKHFDVGIASQRLKSEKTVGDEAAVSGGFAYSPVTIPDSDLTKVRISLFLLDVNGETMASVHKEVDLSGN
ncbi:MAG: hypothetical protein Q8R47_00655 [Nanoarchaeota archaeon]|nr:hypothetical protein [Nanoarchaeota archaeon]